MLVVLGRSVQGAYAAGQIDRPPRRRLLLALRRRRVDRPVRDAVPGALTCAGPAHAEARLLSRLLRVGLALAVLGQIAWSFRPRCPERAVASSRTRAERSTRRTARRAMPSTRAARPTARHCSSRVPQSVDFMLRTGRMPLANPADQPERGDPKFTPEQIDALIAYIASIAPGGEPIPTVDAAAGDLALGAQVFLTTAPAVTVPARQATPSAAGRSRRRSTRQTRPRSARQCASDRA